MADATRTELIHFMHGPVREQQHQPRAFQSIHQEPQRFKRHGIGPVQILDNDQKRRQGQPPFENGADREKICRRSCAGSTCCRTASGSPRPRTWK